MTWSELAFVAFGLVAFAVDAWLIETKRRTVSERIWRVTGTHPVALVLGLGLWVGGAYLLWDSKPSLCVWWLLGGHLWAHR